MKVSKLRILVLISGGGSTMQRVVYACRQGEIYGDVVGVIANNGSAGGINKAEMLGIKTTVLKLNSQFGGNRLQFGEAILNESRRVGAHVIAQLGWLAMTPKNVASEFKGRIINQHPGPLDPGRLGFGGMGMHGLAVHTAVLHFARNAQRWFPTEATVHEVTEDEQYDLGELLGTRALNIKEDESPLTLAQRLSPLEHELVVETLNKFVASRVTRVKRDQPLIWPNERELYTQAIAAGLRYLP